MLCPVPVGPPLREESSSRKGGVYFDALDCSLGQAFRPRTRSGSSYKQGEGGHGWKSCKSRVTVFFPKLLQTAEKLLHGPFRGVKNLLFSGNFVEWPKKRVEPFCRKPSNPWQNRGCIMKFSWQIELYIILHDKSKFYMTSILKTVTLGISRGRSQLFLWFLLCYIRHFSYFCNLFPCNSFLRGQKYVEKAGNRWYTRDSGKSGCAACNRCNSFEIAEIQELLHGNRSLPTVLLIL